MKYCSFFIFIILAVNLSAQINKNLLHRQLDSLVQLGLDSTAFPGCQVVVMHNGNVVVNKSYGFHTYNKSKAVENQHLYDLASITKVTTGLPLLM